MLWAYFFCLCGYMVTAVTVTASQTARRALFVLILTKLFYNSIVLPDSWRFPYDKPLLCYRQTFIQVLANSSFPCFKLSAL